VRVILVIILSLILPRVILAQGVFQSNAATGNWTNAASWTLVSGSDADGIPDSNDDVTITGGNNISINTTTTQFCKAFTLNNGTLTLSAIPSGLLVTGAFNAVNAANVVGSSKDNVFAVTSTGSFNINALAVFSVTSVHLSINNTAVINGQFLVNSAVDRTWFFPTIRINSGGTWTNNSTQTLQISGNFINNSSNLMTPCSTVDGCNYVMSGSSKSLSGTGTFRISRLVVNNSITNQNNLIMTDDLVGVGTFTNNGNLTLNTHAGGVEYSISTFDFNNVDNTVLITGDTDIGIDIDAFYNLEIALDPGITADISSTAVDIGGDLTITSGILDVSEGLTVAGEADINSELNFLNDTGAKSFSNVTINVGGTWTNSSEEDFTISGSIINNGTWTGCSSLTGCDYTLTSSGGTISGSGDIDMANLIVSNSITNVDNLNINNNLSGAGTFTNDGTLTLNHHAGTPSYTTAVMDFNNPGSQVILTGNTSDIIEIGPFFDLEISMDPGITNSISTSSVSVENNLDIFGGTLEVLSNTLSVTGNVDIDGGELLINSVGAVINAGTDIILTSGEYDQNNGDVNITENLQVLSGVFDLAIGAGPSTIDAVDMSITTGAVALNGGDLTLTGGLTQNSGSLLVEGTDIGISGAYNISGGTTDFNTGSLSAASFDIGAGLEITVGNVDFSISGASNIDGTITFDSGTGIRSFGDVIVNATGTWSNNTDSDFTISGDIISNGNDWIGCSNTDCDYTLTSGSGTISGDTQIDMSDVIIGGGASYENIATLTVSDRLTGAGEFINGANAGFRYQGDNSAGANFDITTFTASAIGNEVKYSGSTDQQLRATSDNTYYSLTITTNATGDDLTMTSSESVTNELTLTTGIIIMGNNTLTLADGGVISGGDGNSYLRSNGAGVFKREMSAIGTYFAPVGGAFYSPITLDITAATIGGSASLDFSVTDSDHPQRDRDNTADVPAGDDNAADKPAAVDYLDVYWTVTGNNITDPVFSASYLYDQADFTQTTESNMVGALYRDIGGTLDWLPRGNVNPATNTVSFDEADGFGDFYAMDNTDSRLPIVLLSFGAKATTEAVELEWVTAVEINNQFFTIERSVNGVDFEPIIFVEGSGTTNDKMEYQAIDENPLLGRSYYKLKQTDFNGQFEYSEMLRVVFEGEDKFEFGLNSNPVNQGESITIWKTTSLEGLNPLITIRDIQGQELVRTNLSSLKDSAYQIPSTNHLSAGIYLLSVNYLGETHTKKVIVK
jgi:hypothetical protein